MVRHGTTSAGKQRYRCRECLLGSGRTLFLEYTYASQSPGVKQQIVDMAMYASGIRDTARVLHVSPTRPSPNTHDTSRQVTLWSCDRHQCQIGFPTLCGCKCRKINTRHISYTVPKRLKPI
jgi:hypothetical protein